MNIDWSALGEVAGVSVGTTVAVVVVFACGVRALAPGRAPDGSGAAGEGAAAPFARVVAGVCFLACLAAVAYGLYLIVPQFH